MTTLAATVERFPEIASRHERLIPFLLDPDSYAHRPHRVKLIQTHASYVVLAAPYVYKVKKPVRLGFLDFSSVDKRHYYCEREVELNRRLCPRMYLGVVPISRIDGRLRFGLGDEVVDYAVKMKKLSSRHFLNKMVERGAAGCAELDRVATRLKTFYQAQEPSEHIEAWGRVDRLRISTEENFRQTKVFIGRTLSQAAFETVRDYTDEFLESHAGLFEARTRERRIRDCHGDLHLEHIHLTSRSLHIYDCIEFNDRLRYVDVASDVAFLAMDLDFEGRPDLARHFADAMAGSLEDPGMRQLMDFYKCYRAWVRGKVESLLRTEPEVRGDEMDSSRERAIRYFRLSLRYAVSGSAPSLLVVMGPIASGKSALAGALGSELGWPVFSSDRVRKQMAGLSPHERSNRETRALLYTPEMTRRTYETLFHVAAAEADKGRSAILDATFSQRSHREWLKALCGSHGMRLRVLETHASEADIRRRLEQRDGRSDEVSDARLEDYEGLMRQYEPPVEMGLKRVLRVHTHGAPEQASLRALQALARLQARASGKAAPEE